MVVEIRFYHRRGSEPKEANGIGRGDRGRFFQADCSYFGQGLQMVNQIRRFIAPFPERGRTDLGSVGFNQQAVGRDSGRRIFEVRIFREGYDSRQRKIEAQVQVGLSLGPVAGETVNAPRLF